MRSIERRSRGGRQDLGRLTSPYQARMQCVDSSSPTCLDQCCRLLSGRNRFLRQFGQIDRPDYFSSVHHRRDHCIRFSHLLDHLVCRQVQVDETGRPPHRLRDLPDCLPISGRFLPLFEITLG